MHVLKLQLYVQIIKSLNDQTKNITEMLYNMTTLFVTPVNNLAVIYQFVSSYYFIKKYVHVFPKTQYLSYTECALSDN